MEAKVALITGSTSGIGLGIATEFVRTGYNIIFHVLETEGSKIADEIGKQYTHYTSSNLLDPSEISLMIKNALSAMGKIDVLVNNAGIQYVSPLKTFHWRNGLI